MPVLSRQFHFLHRIKLWRLLLVFVLLVGLSGLLLRQNNLGMVERRNQVKLADQQNGDVQSALRELQSYVNSHMNTGMGANGLYLEKTYQRAYERTLREATEQHTVSGAAYQQADQECRARTAVFQVYVQCVSDKIGAVAPARDPLTDIKPPPTGLFRHSFAAPLWSPDAAGFAVAGAVLTAILIIAQVIIWAVASVARRR